MNSKRIYAFELESHVVKIGISQDVALRMQQVAYARKEKVINIHFTEFAPSAVARQTLKIAVHDF